MVERGKDAIRSLEVLDDIVDDQNVVGGANPRHSRVNPLNGHGSHWSFPFGGALLPGTVDPFARPASRLLAHRYRHTLPMIPALWSGAALRLSPPPPGTA